MAARATDLSNARLLMFTGKGGVGKTSSVVACALAAAQSGRRPLVVEMGHRASLEAVFGAQAGGGDEIGYAPREVGHGVHAMNLDFEPALVEYLEQHIKMKRLVRAITRNNALMRFFQAAPSVAEVATLNKLAALVEARDGAAFRWDPVIVDLDATGHALMLLNLPRVMDGLIGDGPMRKLIDGFSSLLSDPKRAALNLVTLPRELPAQETLELYATLSQEHDVPLGKLIVNKVPRAPYPVDAQSAAHRVREVVTDAPSLGRMHRAMVVLDRAQARYNRAQGELARLREGIDLPLTELDAHPAVDIEILRDMRHSILGTTATNTRPS